MGAKKNEKIPKKSKKNGLRLFFFSYSLGSVKKIADICEAILANLSKCFNIMAKSRVSTNPMYRGGAGGYSFYVRGGEQVIRQRRNNSNYGATASRSRAQMIRRVKWGNLVNEFRAMKSWQPKAYDSKLAGQTDYNIFMKLNINRAAVALTKEMSEAGCCVVDAYQVSRGSIPPIALEWNNGSDIYITSIVLTEAITNSTTIGALATDIIANNPQFVDKDNLAIISYENWEEPRVEWPYARTTYAEITLDKSSTALVKDIPDVGTRLSKSSGNFLAISPFGTNEVGCVAIHTRKDAQTLFVSSQEVVLNSDTLVQKYTGAEWTEQCILTYGLDQDVPLDPNFNNGVISKVTANGATVANAATLTGSQAIRIYGNSLYGQGYRFVHNGVDYVPLSSTDEYDEYILTAAGSYIIYVGNQVYMSFSVTGISYPAVMTGRVAASLIDSDSQEIVGTAASTNNYCLNYPHTIGGEAVGFEIVVNASDTSGIVESDFEAFEGTISFFGVNAELGYALVRIVPTSANTPVYMTFKDSIIFVGNYTD